MTETEQYFVFKCWQGLTKRGLRDKKTYADRLQYEIDTILNMGFAGYFLIVQDFINWAHLQGYYIGPGRGSAAGSLVSYSLGITNLDPLKWNLLFERFLNPDRISMPDIDIDIEKRFRPEVIEYLIQYYGSDKVAHIGTFNYMRAKAAVKSMARTLGHPFEVGDRLSKLTLDPIHGKPQPLKESLEKVEELAEIYAGPGAEGEVLRWALRVEGLISSIGVHASGVIISTEPLIETVPLFLSKDGEATTQFEMTNVEEIGLIKFDLLGLDALTKMHRCIDIIKERHNQDIDINNINLDDDEVFAKLRSGDSVGIFQLEASTGMRDLMVQIRPTSLEDIAALVAIFRPGPLENPYKEIYLGVRAGTQEPEYLVPELEPILKTTGGWLIYQEQAMEIAKKLCGYTGGEADDLRKAIGKKIAEKMAKHESKFKNGWIKNGLPRDKGEELWKLIVAFASYGFNKSHAAAYGLVTYQTAWLKTYYPTEFMCAVMISEAHNKNHDQLIQCLTECKRLGIRVIPPNINTSDQSFSVVDKHTIQFGLAPIKNLGKSVLTILEERQKGPFTSFEDFCKRVDLSIVNRKKVESLIMAGAFDCFGQTRAGLLHYTESFWNYMDLFSKYEGRLETYNKKLIKYEERIKEISEGAKKKPLQLVEKPIVPEMPSYMPTDELPTTELLAAEHELLGLFVTAHPLDNLSNLKAQFDTIALVKEMPPKSTVTVAVVVTSLKEITTKVKKEKMAFLQVEDTTGTIEITVFTKLYAKFHQLFEKMQPLKIEGVVDITENDEERIVKLRATNIQQIDITPVHVHQECHLTIGAERAGEFKKLLDKFPGNLHSVYVSFRFNDGTVIKPKHKLSIGGSLNAFQQEASKYGASKYN
jgi:DNA polymerase III subunit alpha